MKHLALETLMEKKHPCPDCKQCQWCSDERCRLCLRSGNCRKKLSFAEQIALFEQINTRSKAEPSPGCKAVDHPRPAPSPPPE